MAGGHSRTMVPVRRGLIVHISSWAGQKYGGNVIYGLAKAATDKMASDMAHQLQPHGVTIVSLYPGLVRTEAVLAAGVFDLSNSESPEFIGRAVALGVAVMRCEGCRMSRFGYPNDEGLPEHPLYKRGIAECS